MIVVGLALAGLGVATAPWLLRGYTGLARTLLTPPTGQAELTRRLYHLAQTRTETIDYGAAEIRRIERDLHDGAQARLVAMGMTLGAAEELIGTSPDAARAQMAEGRSNAAIAERLSVTERAVSKHIASIFHKLGLQPSEDDNRRVLAVLAYPNH